MGLVPGLPWPSSRCGKWSVNSLQICCGWGGPWAFAGRNVTWTPLHREAALRDGAFMHIVSGPNRKLTQQFKGEPAGETACWRQWSCGGFLAEARRPLGFCPISYHSWYFTGDCSRSKLVSHQILPHVWVARCRVKNEASCIKRTHPTKQLTMPQITLECHKSILWCVISVFSLKCFAILEIFYPSRVGLHN